MAVSLSVIAAKDSAGTAIAGGLQAQDKSGAGTGPFTLGQVLIDGVAGVNMAAVTAANAVKVDGSAVTQPVSGTVTAAQATAASLNATVVGTGTFAVQAAATLAAETTKVIGTVNLSAAQTLATVTNLSQLGGAAISMGTGVRGAGVQRVTISTDDVVPASQSGTWTVQPGNTANTTAWKMQLFDGTTALPILAASTGAPASSAPALAVSIRDVNANGQAVMASSAPVTLPSDTNGPYSATANFVSGAITTAMTGTTTTSLIAAPGASLRNYITQVTVSNSHATQGTDIVLQDGSGGTTIYTIPAAAVYGGAVVTFPTPLKQPTTNTALFCANVTTGASTKVSASGYKGA